MDGGSLRSAVIGLGNMGGRIARHIRASGLPVVGFDASSEQAGRAGVELAGSVAAASAAADVVLLSLPDSKVVEAVVYGEEGLLEHSREGQVVIDLSTAAPASSVRIHGDFLDAGVDFLDAGVSGGAAAAERGALSIMVGGSAEALERVSELLEVIGEHTYYMGGAGSGHTTKLLNNFLNGVSLAATAEAMVAARRSGLDLQQVLDVINHSSGVNFASLNRFPRIVEGDYLEGGLTVNLMAKDLMLYLDMARELEVTSLAGPPSLGAFNLAAALGYGDAISNRVVDALGDLAGGVRLQDANVEFEPKEQP